MPSLHQENQSKMILLASGRDTWRIPMQKMVCLLCMWPNTLCFKNHITICPENPYGSSALGKALCRCHGYPEREREIRSDPWPSRLGCGITDCPTSPTEPNYMCQQLWYKCTIWAPHGVYLKLSNMSLMVVAVGLGSWVLSTWIVGLLLRMNFDGKIVFLSKL